MKRTPQTGSRSPAAQSGKPALQPSPTPRRTVRPGRLAFVCLAVVTLVCIVLHFTPDAHALFGWRSAPDASPAWTALSSQFVHLGGAHLAANLGALAMLAVVSRQLAVFAHLPLLLFASLVAVCTGLLADIWPVAWYVGLSGALHGVFAALALALGLRAGPARWLGWGLLLGAGVKLALELDAGTGHVGALGIPVAPPAHIYGFVGGGIAYLIGAAVARVRREA